ncbi:glycosyl hydrolase family 28-related protein [Paraburkholderia caledonica]|uniref:glycosyl hydrolase family 28-related protein n=1 Tax=Paraburkholderia caledonica TaxID=134536 RepID=UPI0038B80EB1
MQLIPNAKQQFIDQNGLPLASGTVGFYFPGTLNAKPTYQDAAGTIANTNPVTLDSRGQALIWGSGVYRQIVKDGSGVTIWDQVTEDPNAGLTGNITDAKFVAGTDFTPGTTTQLTLPVAPGSSTNLWIFFDAAFQADDQISSVSGTTLTFASPIPIGVQEVNVKIGTTIAVGIPAAGTVTDATVSAGAGIDSSKLSFLQTGSGAKRRSIQSRLADSISVKDFGAKGDGTTDDTDAFNLAIAAANAAGGGSVYVPVGTYMIKPTGISMLSNVLLYGADAFACVLKANAATTSGMISAQSGANGWGIRGLTIDGGDFVTSIPLIPTNGANDFFIEDCVIQKFNVFGIGLNGGSRWRIENNKFNFTTPALTQNQALNVSISGGAVSEGIIRGNVMTGSAMDIAGSQILISDNFISGWKFGAGITTEFGTEEFQIIGNVCFGGGTLPDVNSTVPLGIECWATRSVIANNLCYSNGGDGIDFGGQYTSVIGNVCFNNGVGGGGSGIVARYANAGQNGSNSTVSGNTCFDTNGASGTQNYGYRDENASLARITISSNNFTNNKTGQVNVSNVITDARMPELQGSVPFTPGTITNGSSAGGSMGLTGAQFGDTVELSWSNDQQGNKLFGWVSSANTVSFRFENNTGATTSFGGGTVRAWVKKPINYPTF